MSELKPCPFCGSEQPQDSKDDGNVPYEFGMSRSCNSCSATVNHGWNTRPIEDALNARIAELEAAQRWIPVGERLPEEGHKVLVLLTDGAISIDLIYGNDFLYENWVGDITHWMPLPKLPEVQDV